MWHPANLPLAFINYERDYEIYITVAEIRWGLPYVSAVQFYELNHTNTPHWIIQIIHTQLTV